MFPSSIKQKFYSAFALLVMAVVFSTVISDHLTQQFTSKAEYNTQTIETFSLTAGSITGDLYDANTQLLAFLDAPSHKQAQAFNQYLLNAQGSIQFLSNYQSSHSVDYQLDEQPIFKEYLQQVLDDVYQLQDEFNPLALTLIELEIQRKNISHTLHEALQTQAKRYNNNRQGVESTIVQALISLQSVNTEQPDQASTLERQYSQLFESLVNLPSAKQYDFSQLTTLSHEYLRLNRTVFKIKHAQFAAIIDALNAITDRTHNLNQELVNYDTQALEYFQQQRSEMRWQIYGVLFFSLASSILLGWLTVRKIIASLNTLKASIINISQGDYTTKISMQEQNDELGEIARIFNKLNHQLIDRQQLEKSNVSIRQRLENIFSHAPIGLIEVDENGVIMLANKELCALLGYDEGELIGQPLSMLISPKLQEYHAINVRNFIRNGSDRAMNNGRQFTIQNKLGESLKVQISISKIDDKDGKFAIASLLDLTELHAMQISFNEQKNLLTAMIKDAPESILITDENRKIKVINPAFTRIFGYEKDEILSQDTQLIYTSELDYQNAGMIRYNKDSTNSNEAFQMQYKKKDGSVFPSETIGGPITNKQGDVIGFMAFIRDITDRQKEQQRIQEYQAQVVEANQRLNIATSSAKIGIWEFDTAQNKLHWNDEMFDLFGRDKDSFGYSLDDFNQCVHPDDLTYINEKLAIAIDKKQHFTEDFRIINPKTGVRHIHVHATMIIGKDNQVDRIIGLNWDRTEEFEAQFKIKQNHQILNTISQAQQHFIGDIDTESVYSDILSAVLQISNASMGFITEFKHKSDTLSYRAIIEKNNATPTINEHSLSTHIQPHIKDILKNKLPLTISIDAANLVKASVLMVSQEQSPYNLTLLPFFAGDKLLGALGLIQINQEFDYQSIETLAPILSTLGQFIEADELEAIKVQQESELKQLALVASKTNNAVIITDASGCIEWVNDAFTKISGYEFNEVKGKKPGSFLQGKNTDPDTVNHLRNCIKNGQDTHVDIINYHKCGSEYWLSIELQVIRDKHKKITQFIAIETDITSKKVAEAQLHDAVARSESYALSAEQANKAKGEFLANMSHEIRTPMNGVLGMLGLLMRSPLNENQAKQAKLAHDSAESLLVLINDILDFSKIEAGKLEIETIDFNLLELLNDFCQGFIYRTHEKQLEFTIKLDKNLPALVQGDPSRLRQVIINLCSNALKFTQKGSITITVKKLDKHLIQFDIQDTGIGIAKDKMSGLFEKFNQLDGSTTRKYGGTGLGLSISSQLVKLMNGDIHVESNHGHGTVFSFTAYLPASEQQASNPKLKLTNKTALIIEPRTHDKNVIREALRLNGMQADCIDSIATSKLQIQQHGTDYDVIFVNIDTHDTDGILNIKNIHDLHPNIPLILTSETGLHNFNTEILDINIAAKLDKPIFAYEVTEILISIFAQSAIHELNAANQLDENSTKMNRPYILLVEDNLINQEVAKGILEEFNCQIDIADNGKIALEMLSKKQYAGILMDCQMPVMDGYQATQRIRAGDAGDHNRNIAIVAMTANTMRGDKEKCIDVGMNDFLSKPIDVMALHNKILHWMNIDFND